MTRVPRRVKKFMNMGVMSKKHIKLVRRWLHREENRPALLKWIAK